MKTKHLRSHSTGKLSYRFNNEDFSIESENKTIAYVRIEYDYTPEISEEEAQANAERIVTAWNEYDKLKEENEILLAACKEALEYRKQKYHGDDKCILLLENAISHATIKQ